MAVHKHLTIEERTTISNMLSTGNSLTNIAKALNRDISTIRLEILKHRKESRYVSVGRTFNNCKFRSKCDYRGKCEKCAKAIEGNVCGKCFSCNDLCSHYQPDDCIKKYKKPYCCNGCKSINSCRLLKLIYNPSDAHKQYRETLSSSREGLNITAEELNSLSLIVDDLIKNKHQSVNAAVTNNPDVFNISSRTLYTYIDKGLFDTRNIDLARKVRFSPRKSRVHHKVDRNCTVNRQYSDFINFISDRNETDVVEIDSVEGVKGSSVLHTIYFRSCSLQLAFIRDSNNARSVQKIFDDIYRKIGHQRFTELFPVILADNGTEFSNPEAIENYIYTDENTGEIIYIPRTKLFYCDPSAPYQKGACERNHEFIRYFIPKGKDLKPYSQEMINLMMNHINSYCRPEKKNLKSPASRFILLFGEEVSNLLNISEIDANSVCLNNSIFK